MTPSSGKSPPSPSTGQPDNQQEHLLPFKSDDGPKNSNNYQNVNINPNDSTHFKITAVCSLPRDHHQQLQDSIDSGSGASTTRSTNGDSNNLEPGDHYKEKIPDKQDDILENDDGVKFIKVKCSHPHNVQLKRKHCCIDEEKEQDHDAVDKDDIDDDTGDGESNKPREPTSSGEETSQPPSLKNETGNTIGEMSILKEVPSPRRRRLQDGEPMADQQPTLQEPGLRDPDLPILYPMLPMLPIGTLPQFCIFCPASFKLNEDYEAHITKCNPVLSLMTNFAKRKCLVCNRTIRHFNVTGLLRHSISCIIVDRSNRETADAEARAERTRNAADQIEFVTLADESHNATSSSGTPQDEVSRTSCDVQPNSQTHDQPGYSRVLPSKKTEMTPKIERDRYSPYPTRNTDDSLPHMKPEKSASGKLFSQKGVNRRKRGGFHKHPLHVTKLLENFFKNNMYPSPHEKSILAKQTMLTGKQIQDWFFNHRRCMPLHVRLAALERSKLQSSVIKEETSEPPPEEDYDNVEHDSLDSDSDSDDGKPDPDYDEVEQNVKLDSCSEKKPSLAVVKQYKCFSQLPIKLQSIMISAFKADPKPKPLNLIGLSQQVGLPTSKISAWFYSQRRMSTVSDSDKVPQFPLGLNEPDDDYSTDQHKYRNDVKSMTSRQKLTAIKKITCDEITGILNQYKSVIVNILLLFATSGTHLQDALQAECVNLAEVLETNNPFTATQVKYFCEWEEDFVTGMYPEKNEPLWISNVDKFAQLLKVWSRVLVYANFCECELEVAARDISKLILSRSQNQTDVGDQWSILHLFKQQMELKMFQEQQASRITDSTDLELSDDDY